jgi:hypothetical protein
VTAGQPSEVDLDLLADYLGGALTDTPEEAVVARLISVDPDWAAAHRALAQAVHSVQLSLSGWAATTEPMPAEITDRLADALAGAGPSDQSTIPAQLTDQSGRRLTAVPATVDRVTHGRDRTTRAARRRWSRLAGPVAVAAAVVAVAGFGLSRFGDPTSDNSQASSAGADAPVDTSAVPPLLGQPAPERLVATGTDYAPATLAGAVTALKGRTSAAEGASADSGIPPGNSPMAATPGQDRAPLTAGLTRLADRDALAACLDAVAVAHTLGPVTVSVVDYAAFGGSPALVIALTDRTGALWAWVSGPNCGLPGSGPDTRYRAQVG